MYLSTIIINMNCMYTQSHTPLAFMLLKLFSYFFSSFLLLEICLIDSAQCLAPDLRKTHKKNLYFSPFPFCFIHTNSLKTNKKDNNSNNVIIFLRQLLFCVSPFFCFICLCILMACRKNKTF